MNVGIFITMVRIYFVKCEYPSVDENVFRKEIMEKIKHSANDKEYHERI